MKFTLRDFFILIVKRLFDFLLLGNIVFWGGWCIGKIWGDWDIEYADNFSEQLAVIIALSFWIVGGLSTLGIVFRRKELSQKQGFLEFWKGLFLYVTGYFRYVPKEQEGIEPSPRKRLKVKRLLIAGSVLLLLVVGVILIIQYREKSSKHMSPEEFSERLLERLSLKKVRTSVPHSDVELFDMRLVGTGGYGALSGRVKNKSTMTIKEITLYITLYDLTGKPIDSGRATIFCDIPPHGFITHAVESVTGDVDTMRPPEPLKESAPLWISEEDKQQRESKGWQYIEPFLGGYPRWEKLTWTWNYEIMSVIGEDIVKKEQLESK